MLADVTAKNLPGVICLEGEWSDEIESRMSIEPVLRLMESSGTLRLMHRDVATRTELEFHLKRWLGRTKGMSRYNLCYFGFHGTPKTMYLGEDELSLDDFAEILAGKCNGKVLYFASCKVLAAPDDVLQKFCKTTGAKAIVGYTRDVDWFEAAAFELLMISHLVHSVRMKSAYNSLTKSYPDLTGKLGFRMAHANWASDRAIAQSAIE